VRGRIERLAEPAVLMLLAEGARHGYDLKDRVTTLVGDHAEVGNLYRLLRQLELEGIVGSSWDTAASGPARRVYRITAVGRRLLDEWVEALRRLDSVNRTLIARCDGLPARGGDRPTSRR
jgi:DNA-binding PadR family transcriptional regulator